MRNSLTRINRARRVGGDNANCMLDQNKLEEAAHLLALRTFAQGLGIGEEVAAQAYRAELYQLGASARIQRFVGVLAEKRVKDKLRRDARPAPRR